VHYCEQNCTLGTGACDEIGSRSAALGSKRQGSDVFGTGSITRRGKCWIARGRPRRLLHDALCTISRGWRLREAASSGILRSWLATSVAWLGLYTSGSREKIRGSNGGLAGRRSCGLRSLRVFGFTITDLAEAARASHICGRHPSLQARLTLGASHLLLATPRPLSWCRGVMARVETC
jgi:hypothetical protein